MKKHLKHSNFHFLKNFGVCLFSTKISAFSLKNPPFLQKAVKKWWETDKLKKKSNT